MIKSLPCLVYYLLACYVFGTSIGLFGQCAAVLPRCQESIVRCQPVTSSQAPFFRNSFMPAPRDSILQYQAVSENRTYRAQQGVPLPDQMRLTTLELDGSMAAWSTQIISAKTRACMARGSNSSGAQQATKITVRRVESSNQQQLQDFKSVTRSYLEWLGEDLGFQGTERELASLPGSYATERGGCMLLAYEGACNSTVGTSETDSSSGGSSKNGSTSSGHDSEQCVGAVALRSLAGHAPTLREDEGISGVPLERACEMKRLFVMPGHHGRGVGAALSRELLAQAAQLGYQVGTLVPVSRRLGAQTAYVEVHAPGSPAHGAHTSLRLSWGASACSCHLPEYLL